MYVTKNNTVVIKQQLNRRDLTKANEIIRFIGDKVKISMFGGRIGSKNERKPKATDILEEGRHASHSGKPL